MGPLSPRRGRPRLPVVRWPGAPAVHPDLARPAVVVGGVVSAGLAVCAALPALLGSGAGPDIGPGPVTTSSAMMPGADTDPTKKHSQADSDTAADNATGASGRTLPPNFTPPPGRPSRPDRPRWPGGDAGAAWPGGSQGVAWPGRDGAAGAGGDWPGRDGAAGAGGDWPGRDGVAGVGGDWPGRDGATGARRRAAWPDGDGAPSAPDNRTGRGGRAGAAAARGSGCTVTVTGDGDLTSAVGSGGPDDVICMPGASGGPAAGRVGSARRRLPSAATDLDAGSPDVQAPAPAPPRRRAVPPLGSVPGGRSALPAEAPSADLPASDPPADLPATEPPARRRTPRSGHPDGSFPRSPYPRSEYPGSVGQDRGGDDDPTAGASTRPRVSVSAGCTVDAADAQAVQRVLTDPRPGDDICVKRGNVTIRVQVDRS